MKKAKRTFTENNTDVLLSEGVSAYQAGNIEDADTAFRQVLKLDANHADANHLLGLIARQVGNNKVAIDLISKAILADSDNAFYHNNLGNALKDLDRINEAVASYRKAIAILPNLATAHSNLGSALRVLGQLKDGKASLQMAIRLEPDMASAHVNLGNIMKDMGRNEDAEASYRSGLNLDPNNSDALTNIGSLLEEQNHDAESIDYYRKAIAIDPDSEIAHKNMANVLYKTGSLSEAENVYRHALELNPKYKDTEFGLSLTLLSLGQLKEGWLRYESRFNLLNVVSDTFSISNSFNRAITDFAQPEWNGSALVEKSIILWGDQGLGDEVRFASIIPDLQRTGAKVTIECDKRLTDIFARSFPEATILAAPYVESAKDPKEFDYQCPLTGLARFFRNDYESFANDGNGHLKADPALTTFWKKRLKDIGPQPKIGISWNSVVTTPDRIPHYASIEELSPILNTSGIDFVNLQSHESNEDLAKARKQFGVEIHTWNDLDYKNDLNGIAALTSNLDLVISFPTFSAELAGSLGVPTLCFVSHKNSFEELGSNDNIWYHNTHHISKNINDPWQPVFEKIAEIVRLKFDL
jgi:tetratricopeptide (TPR) repeat protein